MPTHGDLGLGYSWFSKEHFGLAKYYKSADRRDIFKRLKDLKFWAQSDLDRTYDN